MKAAPVMGLLLVALSYVTPQERVEAAAPVVVDAGPAVTSSLPERPAPRARYDTERSQAEPVTERSQAEPVTERLQTIPETIAAAAAEFDQDPALLTAVAFCESSFRPAVVGDGGLAVGLFQFHPDTWREESRFLGYTSDLRDDPTAASRVAAFMFSQGLQHRWTCYGKVLAKGTP